MGESKGDIIKQLSRKVVSYVRADYKRQTIASTIPSTVIDLLFIFFNGLLAFWFSSFWYGTMCAYYILLTIMRVSVLMRAGWTLFSKNKVYSEIKAYRSFHKVLIVMDIILAGAIVLLVTNKVVKEYPGFIIYLVALYTFYKVTLSLINLLKATRSKSLVTVILRKIGNIDALVSLLILESALLNRFGNPRANYAIRFNIISGSVVCAIILLMAVSGLIKANKMKRDI